MVGSNTSNPLSSVKSHFETNSLNHLYNTNSSGVHWNEYGIEGYVPYSVLFDMDGAMRLRHTGNLTGNSEWENCIKQCTGNWP